jgi:glutamate-ammonia-ligase adenylyltransferase
MIQPTSLAQALRPCGPVVDAKAAARARLAIGASDGIEAAWPALEPVFAASPYLAGLARRDPAGLLDLLASDPDARLNAILADTADAAAMFGDAAGPALRRAKRALHLLTALCDLGGVWDLEQVTGALTRFADAAVAAALTAAARDEVAAGRLLSVGDGAEGPVPGWFCIAMGKQGAFELNYSSDIDVSVFFDPERLAPCLAPGVEPQAFAVRLTQRLAELMQARTAEGYVFRIDLRLRPDPASTPPAVSTPEALEYYESVGQNWERAAFIKARACAGDLQAAADFLAELEPFVWRRNLDFAAIADIQSIKQQIHIHKTDERMTAAGVDLKLGRGGIREIEFYVQTQQLILGGRQPGLRSPRTLDALAALTEAGHVSPAARQELTTAYRRLRDLEHRVQMLADEQTHRLPIATEERRRVAALTGFEPLRAFDAGVTRTLKTVNARYAELFAEAEPLSSRFGSLVFTGVDDDAETLRTLTRMGFADPARVSATIRGWHHGRVAATRTARGRELFTRLAPRLLEAAHATGAPEVAFGRFVDFFGALSSGVQLMSLFLAQPRLFELVVRVLAFAPRLATTLARRPAAIEAMVDPGFFGDFDIETERAAMADAVSRAEGFEAAMDAVRRQHREQAFRIGAQVISGAARSEEAGAAFADLADLCIGALAPAALAEAARMGGAFHGQVAVVALGKCGSREMSATSDLDLMTLYRADDPAAVSATKGWDASTFYARFTQRLIAALSSPTAEGQLYEVDMKLRPSGAKGPVAVSWSAFESYYGAEAETWEFLALTRARVVWASDPDFAGDVSGAIARALRRPRDPAATAADVVEMRSLMARERPPAGSWDLKLAPGGLVDIEFAAQYLQIVHGAAGGPLESNTARALAALGDAKLAPADTVSALLEAWRLQQDLAQLLKVALADPPDPEREPRAFQTLLAAIGGARNLAGLKSRLAAAQAAARKAHEAVISAPTEPGPRRVKGTGQGIST